MYIISAGKSFEWQNSLAGCLRRSILGPLSFLILVAHSPENTNLNNLFNNELHIYCYFSVPVLLPTTSGTENRPTTTFFSQTSGNIIFYFVDGAIWNVKFQIYLSIKTIGNNIYCSVADAVQDLPCTGNGDPCRFHTRRSCNWLLDWVFQGVSKTVRKYGCQRRFS